MSFIGSSKTSGQPRGQEKNGGHLGCGLGEYADLFIDQRRQMFSGAHVADRLFTGRQPLQDFLGERLQRGGHERIFR
ncbi:hypothetical protein ATO49_23000 [Mycolicibacterium fortuitum subsp. fortuitum DSM 46621 = ATCC 6841 = JCM 6387]|nr:hypothetical protein ATO49_23000 [Mycolicibacterium fortuitum subsp. fortuitum DSM 46621 = ATCC 6841 = JCM 6387]